MTKAEMISTIQLAEATAWLQLAEYNHEYAPTQEGQDAVFNWRLSDEEYNKKCAIWCALSDLLRSCDIHHGYDELQEKAMELNHDTYIRAKERRF